MKPYYENKLVTLYHGDALEVLEWLNADAMVTDPPYGIKWTPQKGSATKAGKPNTLYKIDPINGDNSLEARNKVLELWGNKPAIIFGSWKAERPKNTNHRLIWHKAGMPSGPLNAAFMTNDEEIYVLGKGFKKSSPPLRSVIRTDEHRPSQVRDIGHPTPKPIDLMEKLVDRCPGEVIADPFAGSGSTLIAAQNLNRKAIGVELEEKFCEIAATRLETLI